MQRKLLNVEHPPVLSRIVSYYTHSRHIAQTDLRDREAWSRRSKSHLKSSVFGSPNDVVLKVRRQIDKVSAIAGHSHQQAAVLVRVLLRGQ